MVFIRIRYIYKFFAFYNIFTYNYIKLVFFYYQLIKKTFLVQKSHILIYINKQRYTFIA